MSTYSIDDAQSNQLCAGIRDAEEAERSAQAIADRLGQSVWLFGIDFPEGGEEFPPVSHADSACVKGL